MTTKEKPIIFSGEKWIPVLGYEDRYVVSDMGRIKSLGTYRPSDKNKVLKLWKTKKGYLGVSLRCKGIRKSFMIHQLVMRAFVGFPENGLQVAHNNGIPNDNKLSNLRYVTPKENMEDRRRHGRTARGSRSGGAKLDEAVVKTLLKIKNLNSELTTSELAHLACVHRETIENIFKGEQWKHVSVG